MSTQQRDNSIPAAVIGAVIGGICTIIAAIIGLYGYNQSNQIEVPNVIGYSVDSATEILAENQLQYKIDDSLEFSINDLIQDQSIEPGTYVSKGTTVILTVETEISSCENHIAKELTSIDPNHPHYKWYICKICGEKFATEETTELKECDICFPSPSVSSTNPPEGPAQTPDKTKPNSSGQNTNGNNPSSLGAGAGNSSLGNTGGSSSESQPDNSTQISEPLPADYSIKITHTVIPEYFQFTDENVRITATTSHKATAVKLTVTPAAYENEYDMHSDNQTSWTFKACFDTAGTYTITAVAYFEGGITKSDSLSITYPFN